MYYYIFTSLCYGYAYVLPFYTLSTFNHFVQFTTIVKVMMLKEMYFPFTLHKFCWNEYLEEKE